MNSAAAKQPIIILGIDPGLADMGFGVIEKTGSRLKTLDYGSIKTAAKQTDETRLVQIKKELDRIIKKYRPSRVGIEKLFFGNNAKTAIAVGQARGVAVLCAGEHCLAISEFTPLQVKLALTSWGQADKKQVQQMVKVVLGLKEIPKPDDAADALAIAVCCANSI
jgi:crossover junction endodeoxyribonuclease RuvC